MAYNAEILSVVYDDTIEMVFDFVADRYTVTLKFDEYSDFQELFLKPKIIAAADDGLEREDFLEIISIYCKKTGKFLIETTILEDDKRKFIL